jgi:hypothetical protein
MLTGWEQAFEPIEESDNLPTQFPRSENDATQDGIQARTVTPARQDADTGLVHLWA